MNVSTSGKQKLLAVAGLLFIVAASGEAIGAKAEQGDDQVSLTASAPNAEPVTAGTSASNSMMGSTSGYKNGTYSASGSYDTPGNTDTINVSLTITNGVVTSSTVTEDPSNPESRRYAVNFLSTYKSQVIGKSIETISLYRVSGSSLTSGGFNTALAGIKAQAKS